MRPCKKGTTSSPCTRTNTRSVNCSTIKRLSANFSLRCTHIKLFVVSMKRANLDFIFEIHFEAAANSIK
ncbi:unnamed protein product [Ceratitis capitata]|uniref:(Mediterranean fruit fly) hypothetical protein n=1 Tax=Ceratitis capitata TaxID=7213 RepID=A0A811U6T5_CERCA|nr:unnamed protein product [Ceratitis capitata]